MSFIPTYISDLIIFEPNIIKDSRGYFLESYNYNIFKKYGIEICFVQDNQSQSSKDVLRGLHYQISPFEQAKLIRVLSGKIWDVAVDIRKNSPTFGKWFGIELNAENKKQLFIPVGFAHGFSVLSEKAEVFYKCSNFYSKEHDRGILFNDPQISIDWKIGERKIVLSDKDKNLPLLQDIDSPFVYQS